MTEAEARAALLQHPVDRRAADAEPLGDLRRPHRLPVQPPHLRRLRPRRRLAPLVAPFRLRLGDALALPLQHQRALELRHRPEHGQHHPPRRLAGVEGGAAHGQDVQRRALGVEPRHDAEQVRDGARQPVRPGDHQQVAFAQVLQRGVELRSPADRRHPLSEHLAAAGGAQVPLLRRQAGLLLRRGGAGVADHGARALRRRLGLLRRADA